MHNKSSDKYLYNRDGVYQFIRRIPVDLSDHLDLVYGAGGETRTPTSRGNQILLTNYGFRRPLLQKSQQELFVVWTFSSPYLY